MPPSPSLKSKLVSNPSSPGSLSSPFPPSSSSKPSFLPQGQKTKFQSQDSQGSDISYESSIQSQDDINIGRVEFFKQEMSRFFINYPELINHEIIQKQMVNENNLESYFLKNSVSSNGIHNNNVNNMNNTKKSNNILQNYNNKNNKTTLNKNWSAIADQILNQAKQSTSFLQDLSRRIALYRSKVQQQDLIDLLLKEQKNIMKEIQLEINQKKKQVKGNKNTENMEGAENMYFSWRKKKEIQNRLNLVGKDEQVSTRKHSQNLNNKSIHNSPKKSDGNRSNQSNSKHRSLHKANKINPAKRMQRNNSTQQKQLNKSGGAFFVTQDQPNQLTPSVSHQPSTQQISKHNNLVHEKSSSCQKSPYQRQSTLFSKLASQSLSKLGNKNNMFNINDPIKQYMIDFSGLQKQNKSNYNQTQTFWKHLVNFQPKTQAGRQLCELIRKTNNPNDQLGIKKTIMTFLSRSKDMVQNQIVLKSTISQKIQKLYNDDSKQLLMFYPTRMSAMNNNVMNNPQNNNNNNNNNTNTTNANNNSKQNSGNQNTKDQLIDSNSNTKFFNNSNTNSNSNKQSSQMNQHNKMFQQGEKFMKVLEDIVEGPLMKYWMSIQENKL